MVTYRSVLEVLKWSSPEDTLRDASCVSTHWQTASESEELWMEYCGAIEYEDSSSYRKQRYRYIRESLTLALIAPKKLFLYDTAENKWRSRSLSRAITVDKSSAWVAVGGNFICAGGGAGFSPIFDLGNQKFKQAFQISRSGEVRRLPDIATPRMWHGMIKYRDWVFVFGGLTGVEGRGIDTKSVEKISASRQVQWKAEEPMLCARRCFNPCIWQSRIYIFGGNCTQSEVFFPEESRYESLSLQCIGGHCSTVCDRGSLVVLGGGVATSWDGAVQSSQNFQCDYTWGNMCPVAWNSMYWITQTYNNFGVAKLKIETGEAVILTPPDYQKSDFG